MRLLLEAHKLSGRQLHARMLERDPKVQVHSVFSRLITGENRVHPKHMEAIASALHILPETFAEYRLWKVRREFDPEEVGWDRAITNLQRHERAEGAEDDLEPHDPADLLDDPDEHEGRAESS